MRIPQHIGIIPDGNRRWAVQNGMEKQDGYRHGISPGLSLYRTCRDLGIREMSFYGRPVGKTHKHALEERIEDKDCKQQEKGQ